MNNLYLSDAMQIVLAVSVIALALIGFTLIIIGLVKYKKDSKKIKQEKPETNEKPKTNIFINLGAALIIIAACVLAIARIYVV